MSQYTDLEKPFTELREVLADNLLSANLHADNTFELLFRAATAKSLDFNVRAQAAPDTDGILYQPFLRGLTEDLIYLRYLDRLENKDREDLLRCLHNHDFFRAVDKQRAFFEARRPSQPIYLAELHGSDAKQESCRAKKRLKTLWQRFGWPRRTPTVRDLAEQVSLLELYDYLYAATSRIVHFTPHSLLRLGWCEIAGTDPEALDGREKYIFSLSHFASYHAEFTRFYGAFLFLLLHDLFESRFPKNQAVSSAISSIRGMMNQHERWPEVVTFEEMNVSLEDGIHFFQFTKSPLAITLMKGLPKHIRKLLKQRGR